jgi:lysophospholipase L1-like esterase
MSEKQTSLKRIVFINVCVFFCLVLGLELIGQVVSYQKDGRWLFTGVTDHRALFRLHPYLVGQPRSNARINARYVEDIVITTNQEHLRHTGADPDDENLIRIAVLGGSTTFGVGVTDEDTWPFRLQQILGDKFSVRNYGVPGYSTAENIIQMALLVPETKPHIVVYYEGENDIRNYHNPEFSSDYYSHGLSQYGNLSINIYGYEGHQFIEEILGRSGLIRIVRWTSRKLGLNNSTLPTGKSIPDPRVDKIYVRNLNTLRLLAEGIGAKPIFVPQIINADDFIGKATTRIWTPYVVDNDLPRLLQKFNGLMREICNDNQECRYVESVNEASWKMSDFVDDQHLSAEGGDKFARILAPVIVELAN